MQSQQPQQRELPDDETIKQLRAAGLSWASIGDRYGYTGQWMWKRFTRLHGATAYDARQDERQRLVDKVNKYLDTYGPVTLSTVRSTFDLDPAELRAIRPKLRRGLVLRATVGQQRQVWTDEAALNHLRQAVTECGEPMKMADYRVYAKEHGLISPPGLVVKFGSWGQACAAAGIRTNRGNRRGKSQWSREQVLRIVAQWVEECVIQAKTPTLAQYEIDQRAHPTWPCGTRVRAIVDKPWAEIVVLSGQ